MIILRVEDIKKICTNMLFAIDDSDTSKLVDLLEIENKDNYFYLRITNNTYYAEYKINSYSKEEFRAVVDANLFLKLISKTTSETVQFDIKDNFLILVGNGEYKLPLVYKDSKILNLPTINVDNVTNNFNISSKILKNILVYNTKELQKGVVINPVQKCYYIDNKGAITFTSGACINDFSLEDPVKILLSQKLVRLFKLFNSDNVEFIIGQDSLNDIIQTKVKFITSDFSVTSIINSDESLINSIPAEAIREKAHHVYPYTITINSSVLLQSIERLLLFNSNTINNYSKFEFGPDSVKIYTTDKSNFETVNYDTLAEINENYSMILDLVDLKNSLEDFSRSHISFNFGDHQAVILDYSNIHIVIPEVIE